MNELPEKLMQYDVISYEYKLTKQSRPDVVCTEVYYLYVDCANQLVEVKMLSYLGKLKEM